MIKTFNKAILDNLTDSELTQVCTFLKPDDELEGMEYLVHILARRLETANGQICLYEPVVRRNFRP